MVDSVPVICIDGPSGSGKGTIGIRLAQELSWHFLDSGALYRALAFITGEEGVSVNDERTLSQWAEQLPVYFKESDSGLVELWWHERNITELIRSESCGERASQISAFPLVREGLLLRQRAFQQWPGLVADGRDMGTVVFPNAFLKIYLTASVAIRAQRRQEQLKAKGIDVTLEQLSSELKKRDERDQHRAVAPLKPAADAVLIDCSHLEAAAVLELIQREYRRRKSYG